jgi:uncharacterized membrane protein (UPF0127 family)
MLRHSSPRGPNLQIVARDVLEARSFFARGKGLLGRASLPMDTTMWIVPCNNIHTWFMQFPIDVIFVDRKLVVQTCIRHLEPFRLIWPIWKAHSVFEFQAGAISNIEILPGDQLHVGT